jgi:hypothetical protein
MGMDARQEAEARGLFLNAPDRPDLHRRPLVDYVVRQYPQPGAEVPQSSVVYVWFDFGEGEGEGGAGVREPRRPIPPPGGMQRELGEPDDAVGVAG